MKFGALPGASAKVAMLLAALGVAVVEVVPLASVMLGLMGVLCVVVVVVVAWLGVRAVLHATSVSAPAKRSTIFLGVRQRVPTTIR